MDNEWFSISMEPQQIDLSGPSDTQPVRHSLNYSPLLKRTEEDVKRWKDLPLTLLRQISCIKINILPKYLYLFKIRSHLEYNSVLQRPTDMGGLNVPNFERCYWAAQATTSLDMAIQPTPTSLCGFKIKNTILITSPWCQFRTYHHLNLLRL